MGEAGTVPMCVRHKSSALFPYPVYPAAELGASITGARCYPETKEHGARAANNKLEVGPSRDRLSSRGQRVCLGYVEDLCPPI